MMKIKFKTDANGKILDNDKLFVKIDELIDSEKYAEAAELILSVPEEQRSNKMRFRLICAYNNLKEFDKSEKELGAVRKLCETSSDLARYHYMFGYMNYMNDCEMLARDHYKQTEKLDPEYSKSIELAEEIKECEELIQSDLVKFGELCERAADDIKKRCFTNLAKREVSEDEFRIQLGFFPGIRKLPGFDHTIGFRNYRYKYSGSDVEKCRQWFAKFYGVTDRAAFFKHIQTDPGINLSPMMFDVAAYVTGKPNFDINELNEGGRFSFESNMRFITSFIKFLPKSGVAAWDIGEKIGLVRHAFACSILTDEEYDDGMAKLAGSAKKAFDSAEEYMRSLIFGAGLYMFNLDRWSIRSARQFLSNMMGLLLRSELADIKWQRDN